MKILIFLLVAIMLLGGCTEQTTSPEPTTEETSPPIEAIDRESKIPPEQMKITPETDLLPPILHSDDYSEPVPMPYPINTAGAEDSGFIMPDGNTFYVWFTPDPNAPLSEQLDDGVTGIYEHKLVDGDWQQPELIVSQFAGESSVDNEGNIYFTHHFYKDGVMLEADIYVIYKK